MRHLENCHATENRGFHTARKKEKKKEEDKNKQTNKHTLPAITSNGKQSGNRKVVIDRGFRIITEEVLRLSRLRESSHTTKESNIHYHIIMEEALRLPHPLESSHTTESS